MGKTMEKLTSGFRINRAADDAAGLAISEKMRSQISGMTQAVENTQNGISLIQTAEGALDETVSILHRIRELNVQAINGGKSPGDIQKIQAEKKQLIEEIDRIAQNTEFNSMSLLDGSHSRISIQVGANKGQHIVLGFEDMGVKGLKLHSNYHSEKMEYVSGEKIPAGSLPPEEKEEEEYYYAKESFITTEGEVYNKGDKVTEEVRVGTVISPFGIPEASERYGPENTHTDTTYFDEEGAVVFEPGDEVYFGILEIGWLDVVYEDCVGKIYQEGELIKPFEEEITEPFEEEIIKPLEKEAVKETKGIKVQEGFLVGEIDQAIKKVTELRTKLGAMQNRLEHILNNLHLSVANINAAESRIRDADIALEMVELTRHQIMKQSGTAMVSQANLKPQAVLQLLG